MWKEQTGPADFNLEKTVFRYIRAIEQCDDDAIAAILELAIDNDQLAEIIDEINLAYQEEEGIDTTDISMIRDLAQKHFISASVPEEDYDSPIIVGQVAARLQLERNLSISDKEVNRVLLTSNLPIPAKLTNLTINELASKLAVKASERYWRLFRDKAILLAMGHSQGKARIAARKTEQREKKL